MFIKGVRIMKIPQINNSQYNQNISYKAYFNYNSTLKNLCQKAPKDINLTNLVDNFKNSLPNEGLKITKTIIINPPYPLTNSKYFYRVANSVTNKFEDIKVPRDKQDLSVLLSEIYKRKEQLFSNCENVNNNHRPISMENLYKELTTSL